MRAPGRAATLDVGARADTEQAPLRAKEPDPERRMRISNGLPRACAMLP